MAGAIRRALAKVVKQKKTSDESRPYFVSFMSGARGRGKSDREYGNYM